MQYPDVGDRLTLFDHLFHGQLGHVAVNLLRNRVSVQEQAKE